MQFDCETSQFISTNFFEAEAKDEKNYQRIYAIFGTFIGSPFATFIVLTYLTLTYSDWIYIYVMKYIMVGHFKLSSKDKITSRFWSFLFCGHGRLGHENDHENNANGNDHENNANGNDHENNTNGNDHENNANGNDHENNANGNDHENNANGNDHENNANGNDHENNANGNDHENNANGNDHENNANGDDDDKNRKSDRKTTIFRINFAFIFLTFALFAIHIKACVKLIQYGNEVLYQHEDYHDGSLTDDGESMRNDRGVTIGHFVVSLFCGCIIILILIGLHVLVIYRWILQDDDQILGAFTQVSLGGFVGYLGFYFAPYMLLAFTNDPIKAAFIYLMDALFILCFYLFIKNFFGFCLIFTSTSLSQLLLQFSELFFTFGSGIFVAYFLSTVLFLFTPGSFDDYQAVHNLTLPIIVILVPLLVFKPLYNNYFKPSGESNMRE